MIFVNTSIARFTTVNPLASDYFFQSPYAYATNNPVLLRDIMGMRVEDIIFRSLQGDGSYKEIGRIVTDEYNETFDISENIESKFGIDLSSNLVSIDGAIADSKPKFNRQAVSFNISAEAAFKGGAQMELSFVGMLEGADKGKWGVMLQGNALVGIEGGVTVSASFFEPSGNGDLRLNDLRCVEYGVQGDAIVGGALFQGLEYTGGGLHFTSIPLGRLSSMPFIYWDAAPRVRSVYNGFSIGMSGGVLPASASAYIGVSEFLYKSK